jgi:hypothetical protein
MADLAIKSDDVRYPYESKGVKPVVAQIELENGSQKGSLYYTAQFIASLALKFAEFEKQTTEKDHVASQYNERSSIDSVDDIPSDATYIPEKTPTPNTPPEPATNNVPAVDVNPNETSEPNGVADKKAKPEVVEMSREELLAQRECCFCLLSLFSYRSCSRIGDYCFPYHFWSPFQEGSSGSSAG